MHVYADTSVLYAMVSPLDAFCPVVTRGRVSKSPAFFYPPWLRFELRHAVTMDRTDSYGETAWSALLAAERSEQFIGAREDWLSVMQSAGMLSVRHAREVNCGAMDVLHVASALGLGAEEFWTCDAEQAALARKASLKVVLFEV